MKKCYKNILFDLDGCLVNSLPYWVMSYRNAFIERGLHPSQDEILEICFRHPDRLPELGIADRIIFMREVIVQMHSFHNDLEPFSSVISILSSSKELGKKIAIVSSSGRKYVDIIVDICGLSPLVDQIITANDVTNIKPHPEPIEKALSLLVASKDESLMVGDMDVDILAAQAAGIDSVWFNSKSTDLVHDFSHHNPTYTIDAFSQLKDILC